MRPDDASRDVNAYTPDDDAHTIWYDEPFDGIHDDDGNITDRHLAYGADASDEWEHLYSERPTLLQSAFNALWWRVRPLIFLLAFITPLIVVGLLLILAGVLVGDDAGERDSAAAPSPIATVAPVNPQWPAGLTFASHTVAARIRNTITSAAEQHGYAFEGTPGLVWSLAVEPYQNSALDPQLTLYGPDGSRLCGDAGCAAGESQSALTVILNAPGTYRVVIESASGTGTGLYLFTLDDG